jgi:hypothetical protein
MRVETGDHAWPTGCPEGMVDQEPSDAGCDPRTRVVRGSACQGPRYEALSALMVRYTAQVLGFVLRARAEALFTRHGGQDHPAGTVCGLLRALPPFIPGVSVMPYRRFPPYNAAGTITS